MPSAQTQDLHFVMDIFGVNKKWQRAVLNSIIPIRIMVPSLEHLNTDSQILSISCFSQFKIVSKVQKNNFCTSSCTYYVGTKTVNM